jgi:hypothetical protein
MLQLAPRPERQRTARCCAHCKDGSSPRLGTAVSEYRACRLQSKASVTVAAESFLREENKRCYLEVESIFLCATDDFTWQCPASLYTHLTRYLIIPSIKQLAPDSPAAVQAHLITAKVEV